MVDITELQIFTCSKRPITCWFLYALHHNEAWMWGGGGEEEAIINEVFVFKII